MSDQDQAELDWWRQVFRLRFGPDSGFPRIGEALCGHHLYICVKRPDGSFVRYSDRNSK